MDEVAEHVTHTVYHRLHDAHQRRFSTAEQPRVADPSPQDATQYVAAAFIGGKYAICQQEGHRTRVVREHAVADAFFRIRVVVAADDLGDAIEHRREEVGVVVGIRTLKHRGNSLESETCIDRRGRKRSELARGVTIELHEHQVPELDDDAGIVELDELLGARDGCGVVA